MGDPVDNDEDNKSSSRPESNKLPKDDEAGKETAVQISICAESDEENEVTSDASEFEENKDRFTSREKESISKRILQNANI